MNDSAGPMLTKRRPGGLGRGLSALLGEIGGGEEPLAGGAPSAGVRMVAVSDLRPLPGQPRRHFDEAALDELAASISARGMLQPIVVRNLDGVLQIVAGERRWRAAQLVGLAEVPVILRIADDRAVLELALIENLQRENLNAIEEAQGYSQLMEQFQLTQELVATKVGKSRAVVANALRILKLPAEVQAYVRDGRISVGHAKVILGLAGEQLQRLAAERIIKENLNVRQTEELVANMQSQSGTPKRTKVAPVSKDAHVASIEDRIRERVGPRVNLRYAKGKGAVEIRFHSDDELERILQILGVKAD